MDDQSIDAFGQDVKNNLFKLWNRLSSGSYFPPPVKRVAIKKRHGGSRPLGIPTVADRIAQGVVKMALEPDLERHFHPDSYGYRPGKSALEAVGVARQRCWRHDWVLDLDIQAFFDTIPHDLLLRAVRKHTDCTWVLLYIERWLTASVQLEDGTLEPRTKGTPQGSVISPLLANLFFALRVRSVDGSAPSRHSVRTLCRRRRVSLSQRVSSSTVAGGSQAAARCVWADVAPTQDTDRVLQGQRPPRTVPQPSGRLSRLLVPAETVDESLGEDVCQLQSGHQQSGRHGDPSDYSRLAARLSHRQTDR